MGQAKQYFLPATPLVPNSAQPLLHYPGILKSDNGVSVVDAYDRFTRNGWKVCWIFRYGLTQASHFHSGSHEVMAVLTGNATIRFGVGDLEPDSDDDAGNPAKTEADGVEIDAAAGDVFLIPAGVAHKTYDASPRDEFRLLTPGDGRSIDADDPRAALQAMELSGFTMLGAYPEGDNDWDFVAQETDPARQQAIRSIPPAARDPILGIKV